ncbi:MAG: HRDC domain-containing protein [Pseudoclavibacter sp.]|nr:HRDC domain-containing protein [Pseudoclavibacter sp.]
MSPADRRRLERGGLEVIDTPDAYAAALERLASGRGPVAVDAERASGYRYSDRAYLVQLFRRDAGTLLIDPIAIGPLDAAHETIRDQEWVLHAASQDLPCLRELGMRPRRIFDTELAARLLGMERVGLGSVVRELLGVELAKAHSADDWSTRPLPRSWLAYAALDVELLLDVRDILAERLHGTGKAEAAAQEFDHVLRREPSVRREEPWRKYTGTGRHRTARNLAIARELWTARDELARETDTAPGRLVPDRSLAAVVQGAPGSKQQLAAMSEFTGRASRSQLDRWWAAIERGRRSRDLPRRTQAADDAMPPHRAWGQRAPEADARLRAARQELNRLSERHEIPAENLLTPDLLRRTAWQPPQPVTPASVAERLRELGARPWQVELVAPAVASAFVEADQGGAADGERAS